jgi:acyl-CoA synthetase (NDP forming)
MQALIDDPDTALGALCVETRDGYYLTEGYGDMLRAVRAKTEKPVILATNVASNSSDDVAVRLAHDGVPVLSGVASMLTVVKKAMAYRDRNAAPAGAAPAAPMGLRKKWEARLRRGGALDEAEGLGLLRDYGVPVLQHYIVESETEALAVAQVIGFPLVMKTAMMGILHKSDVGGVKLGLADIAAVKAAYGELRKALGPRVIMMPMAGKGIEISFGMTLDPQFGPIAMLGAGGVLIEMLSDRRFALPPFDQKEARRFIDGLALRPLLDGKRGAKPADIASLARAFSNFSAMVKDLEGLVAEIDVNPLIVGPQGSIALDALIIPRKD